MHVCSYPGCMKQFDRKYNLKCHLRIHSNEKPYACPHNNCSRSFRWKSSLNHHLMSLDHTPATARRARKARTARRRQAQHPLTSEPQELYASHQLPQYATEIALRTRLSNSQSLVSHNSCSQLTAHDHISCIDLSEVSVSTASHPAGVVGYDVQFVNKSQIPSNQMRSNTVEPQADTLASRQSMQLPLSAGKHDVHQHAQKGSGLRHTNIFSTTKCSTEGRESLQLKYVQAPSLRQDLESNSEPNRSKDLSSIDSVLDNAVAEILCIIPDSKKEELCEDTSESNISVPSLDTTQMFGSVEMNKMNGFNASHAATTTAALKSTGPLVSIFEDSSPTSLMNIPTNIMPSALDALLPPFHFDCAGRRGF